MDDAPLTHQWRVREPVTVREVLAGVAARAPEALAVSSPDESITVGDLLESADACARWLRSPGAPGAAAGTPVAVLAQPSVASVSAMVGVVLSGRPLVVLDTQLPAIRLQQIVDASGAAPCLTDAAQEAVASELTRTTTVRLGQWPSDPSGDPLPGVDGTAIASIVFTSGSTGAPKGVRYSQSHLAGEAAIFTDFLQLTPGDAAALLLPPAFALGQSTMFSALLSGASLHVFDPRVRGLRELPAWLASEGVSRAVMTPSLMRALVGALTPAMPLPQFTRIVLSGEAAHGNDIAMARAALPGVTVVNVFGSSETGATARVTFAPGDAVPPGPLPVGQVVAVKEARIVDDTGAVLGVGEVGTLQVVGQWLAAGYLREPGIQASSLAVVEGGPFAATEDGRTAYTMGDSARLDADGVLRLLGRRDDVVKVRGYLVHPAEAEAALRSLEGISEAVVVGQTDPDGSRLVGYVVPEKYARVPSPAQMRRALRSSLPEWMVPTELVMLESLPRNERGKVDRGALPKAVRGPVVPPVGQWELAVAQIWSEVLERDDVGRDEAFSALGGDSLALEEFLLRLRERHSIDLTSSHVAEAPTVAELAVNIERLVGRAPGGCASESPRARRRHGSVVTLRARGSRTPLFCFGGAGSSAQAFLSLADSLGTDRPVHAFQPHGLEERGFPDLTVGAASRRFLPGLRALQPHGPYLLAGHSLGGLIALDVARQLEAMGEVVQFVALIDPAIPRVLRLGHAPVEPEPELLTDQQPAVPGGPRSPRSVAVRQRLRWMVANSLAATKPSAARSDFFALIGVRVGRFHRPAPWSGRALLFAAELNPRGGEPWRSVLTGSLTTVVLTGEHLAVLRDPHIATIARRIDAEDPGLCAASPEPSPVGQLFAS